MRGIAAAATFVAACSFDTGGIEGPNADDLGDSSTSASGTTSGPELLEESGPGDDDDAGDQGVDGDGTTGTPTDDDDDDDDDETDTTGDPTAGSTSEGGGESTGADSGGPGESSGGEPIPAEEVCDGLDNDLDGLIDEVSPGNASCNGCDLEEYEGNAYWFCDTDQSWVTARSLCQSFGADLASIHSNAEDEFVDEHLSGDVFTTWWLGGTDSDSEGDFVWSDGSPWDYTDWATLQPDNFFGQDCVRIYTGGDWDDGSCGSGHPYVCKAPHT